MTNNVLHGHGDDDGEEQVPYVRSSGIIGKLEDLCEEFDYVSTNIEEHNDNVEAVVITTSDGINRPNNLVDVEENTGRSLFAEEKRKAIVRNFAINGWIRPTYRE
jgi:hypothetical protein